MITRNKNYEKLPPSKDAEPDYFSFFKGLSSNLEVIIIPPRDGNDPLKLKALAERQFFDDDSRYSIDYRAHDTIWFVIDTDSWEEEGKIAKSGYTFISTRTGLWNKM